MEKCNVLSLKSLLCETGKQPATHSRSQAISSSDPTSWFNWDSTHTSSGSLQVSCPGHNQRSLSNDWPLETKPCHEAEHLGSLCTVKPALPSTQPCTILSLCSVVLSFPAARLSWPCPSPFRKVNTLPTCPTGLPREQRAGWKLEKQDHCYATLKKKYSITHWKWNHCCLMTNSSPNLFRLCTSLISYDTASTTGKSKHTNATV